jgi:dimethylhistidine N-methyltransferase
MATAVAPQLTDFACDVAAGLTNASQKHLAPKYFYDELGSALFEAITLLPEYGLTRADERLLERHAAAIVHLAGSPRAVVELGSGSGRKTRHVLAALERPLYRPIDISPAALATCTAQLSDVATVEPVHGEWLPALHQIAKSRSREPILLLFLGSSVGNLARSELSAFFSSLRRALQPHDHFLLGADLVKPIPVMCSAYDDPVGVTAAFNLNVLARINRELGGTFDLRSFRHEARWNSVERAIEMHLVATKTHTVAIGTLGRAVTFRQDESIWTESSHKFTPPELLKFAHDSGFKPLSTWVDEEWPFAEVLWAAT